MAKFKFKLTYGSELMGSAEVVTFSARSMGSAWKLALNYALAQVASGKPSLAAITFEGSN